MHVIWALVQWAVIVCALAVVFSFLLIALLRRGLDDQDPR